MDHLQYSKILEDAIQSEIDSQVFYREAAEALENSLLKEMFLSFAEEEKRHEDTLRRFLETMPDELPFDESTDFHVSETVSAPRVSADMKPADAFALAMKKEEEAMKAYTALAHACTDEQQKKILLDLAAMERAHKLKMEKAFTDAGYPESW